jgi:hypothetical protein
MQPDEAQMGATEEAGRVASGVVEAMKSAPLGIALLVVNIGFLGFAAYILGEVAENARERNRTQNRVDRQSGQRHSRLSPGNHKVVVVHGVRHNGGGRAVSTRPTLSIGSTGTQVMLVQLTLDARPVDGDYGPITADAVERL